jgi:hypothetical protein
MRVFVDVYEGEIHGNTHCAKFDGKWSLWTALRVWWEMRRG